MRKASQKSWTRQPAKEAVLTASEEAGEMLGLKVGSTDNRFVVLGLADTLMAEAVVRLGDRTGRPRPAEGKLA